MQQLERIKTKFDELRKIDTDFSVFGSETHRYVFHPVLTEDALVAFEQTNDLTLPDDYRLFLKEIGNGGAGPFYGLLPLEDNEDQRTTPNTAFGFTAENPCLLEKYDAYDEKIDNAKTDEEEQALWDLKEFLLDADYEKATNGITFLCHEGCCMFSVLILKGAERGTVWWFNFSDQVGVVPIVLEKQQVSFLDWYEMWLDASLDSVKNGTKAFSTYGQFVGLDNIV